MTPGERIVTDEYLAEYPDGRQRDARREVPKEPSVPESGQDPVDIVFFFHDHRGVFCSIDVFVSHGHFSQRFHRAPVCVKVGLASLPGRPPPAVARITKRNGGADFKRDRFGA